MSQQDPPKIFNHALWRSAVSVFFLIVGIYFTMLSIPSFAAATLPTQNSCPDGQEKDAALCYPKCNSGYSGVGPVCWEKCPSGYDDIGAACVYIYAKESTARGAGIIPTGCPAGQENNAALCYPKCDAGYSGVGPVCWQQCPSGFTDTGVACTKIVTQTSYGRGVGTIPTSCGAGKENDGGLCYPQCKAGYHGVGPVCWESCKSGYRDDPASCYKNIIDWYWKDSYGRGVGSIPSSCPAGKENQAGLCYTLCSSGYTGEGPVCWQTCPSGSIDTGAFCDSSFTKKSYGRGVGTTPTVCAAGQENQAGLCYTPCPSGYTGVGPVCWKPCDADFTDTGAFCNSTINRDSYGRGAGDVPPCTTGRKYDKKYTSVLSNYLNPTAFTMIIASDTQFPWWRSGGDPNCKTDECVLAKSKSTNSRQIKAMNNIQQAVWTVGQNNGSGTWPMLGSLTIGGGTTITKPLGVIMNGDLTAYWHPWQVKLYRQYYEPGYEAGATHPVLKLPIFPGLGNHDYANNVPEISGDSCYYNSADKSMCGKKAVSYIKNMVYCDGVSNFVNTLVQRFDQDSLAYSWDIGGYHFVQLNNYPTYAASSISIKSAIAWLKTDLATATAAGQKIVLNFHDYGDHMPQDDAGFLDAINGANVVALFAGHIHGDEGNIGTISGTQIPVFRSGASEYNRFLLVEFGSNYMNVGVINSSVFGTAKFVNSDTKTYVFP
ncbi:MAG: metallophosphoesterase [Methylobacter sp.]